MLTEFQGKRFYAEYDDDSFAFGKKKVHIVHQVPQGIHVTITGDYPAILELVNQLFAVKDNPVKIDELIQKFMSKAFVENGTEHA